MAMAMATPAAAVAAAATGAKSFRISATRSFSTPSRNSVGVARLCTSFTGMSLRTRSSQDCLKHGGESLAELALAPSHHSLSSVAPSKLVFTVAKIKTHKASAKRFRVTGSGKIMRRQAFKQHLLTKKSTRRKKRLSKSLRVSRSDYDNVTRALPYLKVKGKLA